MKCVCIKTCQIRHNDRITFVMKGEVYEFDECPANFRVVAGEAEEAPAVDFTKASEDELKAAKWKFEDANAAMEQAYGKSLEKEEGTKKSDVIAQILDIRYRAVNIIKEPNLPE